MHVSVFLLCLLGARVAQSNTGLQVPRTEGQPLPAPQLYVPSPDLLFVPAPSFTFQLAPGSFQCDILLEAFKRYYALTFPQYAMGTGAQREDHLTRSAKYIAKASEQSTGTRSQGSYSKGDNRFANTRKLLFEPQNKDSNRRVKGVQFLNSLQVMVQQPCDSTSYPNDQMQENYTLKIYSNEDMGTLNAFQVFNLNFNFRRPFVNFFILIFI